MTLNPFAWRGARQQRNGAEIPRPALERMTISFFLLALVASVLAVGCSSKTPEPKDDKKAVEPEWEYVVPSDTSGFTVRAKIDTVRRMLRWIEAKPASISVEYHECRETEALEMLFWMFDDQNWECSLLKPSGGKLTSGIILEMRDGQLTRFGPDGPPQRFERRRRRFTPYKL